MQSRQLADLEEKNWAYVSWEVVEGLVPATILMFVKRSFE
jgi:hypothetical protein